jgi:hypothetical protein
MTLAQADGLGDLSAKHLTISNAGEHHDRSRRLPLWRGDL